MNRVIVAGSRSITDYNDVYAAIMQQFAGGSMQGTEIVHGGADGVDTLASRFANEKDLAETVFEPEWDVHGKAAGPIRNKNMADYGDILIAVWDGESRGTRDMIDKALDEGLETHVVVRQ